jgi:hypothetical protein
MPYISIVHILLGIIYTAVGSVMGFVSIAALVKTMNDAPLDHIWPGSVSLALTIVGIMLAVLGIRMAWAGLFAWTVQSSTGHNTGNVGASSSPSPQG